MSNNKDSELNEEFIKKHINMIKDLYEGEKFLNEILHSKIKRKENFVLFDKDWLEKWKAIIGYETLKEKCAKCKTKEDVNKKVNEVKDLFIQLNTKQKLDELGKMDSSKLKRISDKKQLINEESDFIPILASHSAYFSNAINGQITINSEISKGIIYISEQFPEKDKEQKLILLYKENEQSKDLSKAIITFQGKDNIKNIIKDLTQKNIDEIMKQKDLNIKYTNPPNTNIVQENKAIPETKEVGEGLNKLKGRRSSLKGKDLQSKLDPNNLLKFQQGKRHSVSFGQANTFQFKQMKAMFQEKSEATQEKKENKEEHKKFLESRKKSIKNEFLLVKELMKQKQDIIEEADDSDEEVKKNTDKNIKMGHEELKEESSSGSRSESKSNSDDEGEK